MSDPDDVYRLLQRHIDSMPVPFPETDSGVELRLLRRLFSPAEAGVALALSAVPEPVERIHARLPHPRPGIAELRRTLESLTARGAVLSGVVKRHGRRSLGYAKGPIVIGMFEMQVDKLDRDFVKDFEQYMDEALRQAILTPKNEQMRTVPVNADLTTGASVGIYDDIRSLLQETDGPFGVMNCVCRQAKDTLDERCRFAELRETCLLIGSAAVGMHRMGNARFVTREELLRMIDRAEELGFVLQPQNTRNPTFICCCCADCCEVLTNAKKLPRPADAFNTNYRAAVEVTLCSACERCRDRCPMEALTIRDSAATVDEARCIGCGLCVSTCSTGALRLNRRSDAAPPPDNAATLYARMFMKRFGLFGGAGKIARILLGRRV